MKRIVKNYGSAFVMAAALTLMTSCTKDEMLLPSPEALTSSGAMNASTVKRIPFIGLTDKNEIVWFNTGNAFVEQNTTPIVGLDAGERILAIDFRPATGQLYGVSDDSRIYAIHTQTGVATSASSEPFTPAIDGTRIGFDFNPTVDRIRLVTDRQQNLRLHPETGKVVVIDGTLNPGTYMIEAAAYTNSFAGTSTTTLYTIDFAEGMLYRQNPPNDGTQEPIGPLNINVTGEGGFDISADNKIALAVISGDKGEVFFGNGKKSSLYSIDLTTGKATPIGVTKSKIIGLAIPSNPVAYAVDPDNQLMIFNPQQASQVIRKPITGLQAGERVVGIDMRPATGQLYALGSSSRLYVLNMANGAASAIGSASFSQRLNGSWFGFDFNPTVDRIRIVSNTGQNLRVHPVTGDIAFVDGGLYPGIPKVDAAAYTQNKAGATSTALFVVDYSADQLFLQSPPNNGQLQPVGAVGWDIINGNGFDIGGTTGQAMGIFSTMDNAYLCEVNIQTGQITPISVFPDDVRGFTLGLGF